MRVLVTCFTYAPGKNGVQFVAQYLCEGLVARGHSVTVLTNATEGAAEAESINGVEIERWPIRTRYMHHIGPKRRYVRSVVERQDKFDVMVNVCPQSAVTDWLLPHLGKIGIPKVLHVHSIWDFEVHPWDRRSPQAFVRKLMANMRWGIYYRVHGKDFRLYDRVLQLYEQDYSVEDFRCWYGIESEILENAAEDAFHEGAPIPMGERDHTIVCVANFNRQKNQVALVEAFLRADVPGGWRLVLVGSRETPELDAIRRRIAFLRAELGILPGERNIEIRIGVPREETVRLVKTASIYAMSSLWEAFPVSLVEAMSAGVPWVSTGVGIARWLPGGIVADGVAAQAKALSRLASNFSERERLGAEGFVYAEAHFRIDEKVSQLERVLKEVAGGTR